jgi:hypothetical protein
MRQQQSVNRLANLDFERPLQGRELKHNKSTGKKHYAARGDKLHTNCIVMIVSVCTLFLCAQLILVNHTMKLHSRRYMQSSKTLNRYL